jgi:glycosyltransferase involved in cell wall biosynthesis
MTCADALVATSNWYAERMARRLDCARDTIDVVYPGIEIEKSVPADVGFRPPVLGFLSRLSESQGLGTLVDAFLNLRQRQFDTLRLHATGGFTSADQPFLDRLRAQIRAHACESHIDFSSGFQKEQRADFIRGLSILSVPVLQGEAFGLQLLETMAMGIPVVQPSVGAYPEIIESTGGGLLYDAKKPGALAATLESLLLNPSTAKAIGREGRAAVIEKFSVDRMAADMLAVYERLIPGTAT